MVIWKIQIFQKKGMQANLKGEKQCRTVVQTYACLEQPQTFEYLNFLRLLEGNQSDEICLTFNSDLEDKLYNSRREKNFFFHDLYNGAGKMKIKFAKLIREVANNALKGENQTLFVYGTEEKSKDKILFGQSQNPGLLLCIISELFELCHQKAMEDEATFKISSSLFNKAQFLNLVLGEKDIAIKFQDDYLEGGILRFCPEIIVRNVKTALKLLNIILKHLADSRQDEITQTLIITIKVELDIKKVDEETEIYCLSKINFIKLANPSIHNSLKGINQNNVWFINLLNYLQSLNISATNSFNIPNKSNSEETLDQFNQFLRQTSFSYSDKIYGFVSITNKMSSNQCLTSLLFSNHLKTVRTTPTKCILNIPKLDSQKREMNAKIANVIQASQSKLELFCKHLTLVEQYMISLNYLQYQYSLVIGEACQKLSRYIFTQQMQDFYFAKKINLEKSSDLVNLHKALDKLKSKIAESGMTITEHLSPQMERNLLKKYFQLQLSLAHHFLLEDLDEFQASLKNSLVLLVRSREEKQKAGLQSRERSPLVVFNEVIEEKQEDQKSSSKIQAYKEYEMSQENRKQDEMHFKEKQKKRNCKKQIDNLEQMFKNKNVGFSKRKV